MPPCFSLEFIWDQVRNIQSHSPYGGQALRLRIIALCNTINAICRFAPPGGQTSISLGNYDSSPGPQTTPVTKGIVNDVVVTPTPIKPRVNTSAVVVSSATAKSTSTTFQAVVSGGSLQIGVVVCEAAGLKAATVAALCKLGKLRL